LVSKEAPLLDLINFMIKVRILIWTNNK
jgi:hypothetical protein